jgi:hypothetical protein
MFASRLQTAQIFYILAFGLSMTGILTTMFGSIVVGLFFVVLGQGCAATACYLHAEVKGYPPLIGLPLGVSFGFLAAIVLTLLPDESDPNTFEVDREMTREGVKNAARRDKGYEVLDDD